MKPSAPEQRDGAARKAINHLLQEKAMAGKPPKKKLPRMKEDGKGDKPKGKVDPARGKKGRKA
jgi:hypothetical protein